jgi:DNA-directed RNA polymerase specialized sigma24 family protein
MSTSPVLAAPQPALLSKHVSTTAHDRDVSLVARYQQGDAAAFTEIVRSYHAQVFERAHEVLRNVQDAEKITRITFLHVQRDLTLKEGGLPLASWLFATARTFARAHYWKMARMAAAQSRRRGWPKKSA